MDAVRSPAAEPAVGDLPLTGESVLCVSRGGRAAFHAARLLADLGAQVVLAGEQPVDELERLVLSRQPAIATSELRAAATLPGLDRVLAIVHEGELDPEVAAAAGPDANRVALNWLGAGLGGSDPAAQAAAGPADVLGEPDRESLWFPHRMGEYIQGVNACAMVVLFALGERRGAAGELVLADVWAYAAGTNGLLCTPKGIRYHREGRRSPGNGGVYPQRLYRAADGWIALLCRSRREWAGILEALDSPSWGEEERYRDILAMGVEYPDEVDPLVEAETSKLSQRELYSRAIRLGFPLAPVRSPAEALADEYLGRQSFWSETEGVRLPGPLWREESWIPNDGPAADHARPMAPSPGATDLSGLRVLDLSWVWAGPMVGSSFADLGADVIKVENEARIDNMRLRGKLPSRTPSEHRDINPRETDPLFHNVNRGKRSMLLDLRSDEGREVFLRLVAEADVVIEAFRPHVLDSWKLGYEQLKAVNPRIVLLSLRGLELDERFGPSGLRSYAPITSSLSGMESAIGYPDADGPTGAMAIGISDPVAGWHGTMLALAALLRARRTGRGGWIRLSQLETLASVMPEMYFAAQRPDGLPAGPVERAIHCEDGDLVVAAEQGQWEALAAAVDLGAEGATSPHPVERVAEAAAAAGASAWPVVGVDGHPEWPRRFGRPILAEVDHRLVGPEQLYGHGWRLDGRQLLPVANAPVLGEHTREVLREYLGADEAEIDALEAAGALR